MHNLKTAQPNFTKFFVHVACGRGSVLLWLHCDMSCNSGFTNDVMSSECGTGCRGEALDQKHS